MKLPSSAHVKAGFIFLLIIGGQGKDALAQEPPPEVTREPATVVDPQATPDLSAASGIAYPTRLFSGFGDIVYSTAKSGTSRQFSLGQLTLQYTSALARQSFVFTEVTFSPRSDAASGSPPTVGFNPEVERLFLRYDFNDTFKVSAGRYHTPINWWNTAFHHGLWLQTTIARPEMTRFGGQFIPPHFTGVQLEGGLPAHGMNLYYNLGIGNGRGTVVSRSGDAGDNNGAAAALLNVYVRPDRLYGLQVGGSVYQDQVDTTQISPGLTEGAPSITSIRRVHETILSAHVVYQKENPEVIAEYAHIHHKQDGGLTTNNHAYYVQVAYRRPGSLIKPYYRYERVQVAQGDPVLTATPQLTGNIFGARYDFTELAAFKLEYRNMRRGPQNTSYGASTSGFFAQVSFAF